MKKLYTAFLMALVALAMTATAAFAYTLNPDGTGFVGKGEVQTALGYNNKQLQDNAGNLTFTSVIVTERSWVCTNANNENQRTRERTTTTEGIVASVARERNQITGFNLEGYEGTPESATEGPPLNSCPSGPWSLTTPQVTPNWSRASCTSTVFCSRSKPHTERLTAERLTK